MKILLVGEYSRLHNSLKEGLQKSGCEVFLVGTGDAFKKYLVDYNYEASFSDKPFFRFINKFFARIFKYDIHALERGLKMLKILPKLKNYDIVQLINETPVQTFAWLEKRILKKLIKQNKKVFLLSCGADYVSIKYAWDNKLRYSFLDVYKKDTSLKPRFNYALKYLKKEFQNISEFLYQNINGVIASDFDYAVPLQGNPKFLGLIPNPINTDKLEISDLIIENKIVVFLGINRLTYHSKGIPYFEKALEIIKEKYPNKVEIIITENLPYSEYINIYNRCHILLDQIYAYDQGYNALEAMAKGKVVFTGAEKEFLDYYNLEEDQVAVNTLPDVDYLVEKLSFLIENPQKIKEISEKAKSFIQREHHYSKIAQKYLNIWAEN